MKNKGDQINSVVLAILDGWGIAPPSKGNAIELAKKPTFDYLIKHFPNTELQASGEAVGLFAGMPGHSETGHFNLGAGRIVLDDGVFISQSIENNLFFKNQAFLGALAHVKKNNSRLHLMGLLAEKPTAHANPEHLLALIKLAESQGIKEVFLHLFSDGRDGAPRTFLEAYHLIKTKINHSKIVTLIGRYYAMDRKKDWRKTETAYNLFTLGEGKKFDSIEAAISYAYSRSDANPNLLTDEYIPASVFPVNNKIITVDDNDAIIFFNLRSDRARQLSKVFVQEDFNEKNPGSFKRKKVLKNLFFVALTDFGPDLDDIKTAFPSRRVKNGLTMALKNFSQFYVAEAEKYAHVTYFFNGGFDQPIAGEKRFLVPSPDVESYEVVPEMNAQKVLEMVLKELKNKTNFITVNFANPDIIGHTGNIQATIKAIEFIDKCLTKLYKKVKSSKAHLIITSDHGNAEKKIDFETGEIYNGHTTNPVPFILVSEKYKQVKLNNGILADVAPTILEIMNLEKPKEMTGLSLLKQR